VNCTGMFGIASQHPLSFFQSLTRRRQAQPSYGYSAPSPPEDKVAAPASAGAVSHWDTARLQRTKKANTSGTRQLSRIYALASLLELSWVSRHLKGRCGKLRGSLPGRPAQPVTWVGWHSGLPAQAGNVGPRNCAGECEAQQGLWASNERLGTPCDLATLAQFPPAGLGCRCRVGGSNEAKTTTGGDASNSMDNVCGARLRVRRLSNRGSVIRRPSRFV